MKKLFTFLFAALMSVGMYATTVTWNSSTFSSIDLFDGDSFTKDGVTVTSLNGLISGMDGNWMGGSNDASFKFSTSLGNFTRIEITGDIRNLGGSGWTQTSPGAVWTGDANETTFGMHFKNVTQIVFTIAEPAPTTYTLKLVADPTMGSVAVTNLLGSDIIDNGNGTYTVPENAKVTILATPNEGYAFTGWLEGNVLCDFIDCGVALNTLAACKAEFAAVAPQPAATTVTWDFFFCTEVEALCDDGANIALNNSKDGITVTYSGYDDMDGMAGGGIWLYGGSSSKVIFSSAVGDISKIEVYYQGDPGLTPPDWTVDATNKKFVWEGTPAASVDLMRGTAGNIGFMVDHIVFTIGAAEPTAVENVQTNHVQATKFFRDGMLLIEKNGKIYNATGAEVK